MAGTGFGKVGEWADVDPLAIDLASASAALVTAARSFSEADAAFSKAAVARAEKSLAFRLAKEQMASAIRAVEERAVANASENAALERKEERE